MRKVLVRQSLWRKMLVRTTLAALGQRPLGAALRRGGGRPASGLEQWRTATTLAQRERRSPRTQGVCPRWLCGLAATTGALSAVSVHAVGREHISFLR